MASRMLWGAAIAALIVAAPLSAMAVGSGGMGGGGTPSSAPMPDTPQYDPVVEYQRGQAAYQAGNFKEAARAFQHVTDAQSRNANAWYMLGMSRAGAGDQKGAVKAFQKAVKVDPAPVGPHRELAVTLAKLKDTAKAQAELDALKARATTCNSTCPESTELSEAITAIEQAMAAPTAALDPPSPLIFASPAQGDLAYVRAVSLINEHRYQEALKALDAAEAVFGPHPDILTYKGYTWRKIGKLAQAESYYRQALAIAPDHRGATEYYGELKVERGDMAGARQMLARLDAQCAFGCAEAED
ncbi:MAG TPA: tetratricopeptide repeat protein, partial [Caulobacteraceae bacterium]|nr:tetratricopeptide repeat protein [Caulobacteraceae bacterium]